MKYFYAISLTLVAVACASQPKPDYALKEDVDALRARVTGLERTKSDKRKPRPKPAPSPSPSALPAPNDRLDSTGVPLNNDT